MLDTTIERAVSIPQQGEGEHRYAVEIPSESEAKKALHDVLRPPEQAAAAIREKVQSISIEAIRQHPDADYQKMIEAASGIFLWQNMMYDTGNSLPLGLCFNHDPHTSLTGSRDISINRSVLTIQDYASVMEIFDQHGLLDEVRELQQKHKEANADAISQKVEDYIRSSFVTDYFASFGIGTEDESTRTAPVPPGSDPWWGKFRQLEGQFASEHGNLPGTEAGDEEQESYRNEVIVPLNRLTTQIPDDTQGTADRQKNALRSYIRDRYFSQTPYAEMLGAGIPVEVRDGEFYFPKRDEVGSIVYEKNADYGYLKGDKGTLGWEQFLDREVYANSVDYGVLTLTGSALSESALRVIIPQLYDTANKMEFQQIVDEGIREAAKRAAATIVSDPFVTLDKAKETHIGEPIPPESAVWMQLARMVWLTDVKGNPPGFRHPEILQTVFPTETLAIEKRETAPPQNGEVLFAKADVFDTVPQRIVRASQRKELPTIPGDVDLCIRLDPSVKLEGTTWSAPNEGSHTLEGCDPHIPGMELVARNGDIFYFREKEGSNYDRFDREVPRLKTLEIADFAKAVGMDQFAGRLLSSDKVTIGEVCNMAKEYFVRDSREEGTFLINRLNGLADTKQVDAEGNLHSEQACEYFLRAVAKIAVDDKDDTYDVSRLSGLAIRADGIYDSTHQLSIQKMFGSEKGHFVDVFYSESPASEDKKQKSFSMHDAFLDSPHKIHLLGEQQLREEESTQLATVKEIKPEVMENCKFRLIQQRPRNVELPQNAQAADLIVEISDPRLADEQHDPFIYGMSLVARDGNTCYFQLDQNSHISYVPPEKEIESDELRKLHYLFSTIGVKGDFRLTEPATVASVMRYVQTAMRGYSPEDGTKVFDITGPYMLALDNLIDEHGKIRGGNELGTYFLQTLLSRIYGKDALEEISGFALTGDGTINAVPRHMVHLSLPARQEFPEDAVDCLLSIDVDSVTSEGYKPRTRPTWPSLPFSSRPVDRWNDGASSPSRVATVPTEEDDESQGIDSSQPKIRVINGGEMTDDGVIIRDNLGMGLKPTVNPRDIGDRTVVDLSDLVISNSHEQEGNHSDPLSGKHEKGSLHVPDSKEWDAQKSQIIANVLFVEPSVFEEVTQRLITRRDRQRDLPQTDPGFNNTDLYLEITDSRLADDDHEPYIEGMKLIARDGNTCCFQKDKEKDVYARVETVIAREKQTELAKFCRETWHMLELAADIQAQESLTVTGLRDIARNYVQGWVPRNGAKAFKAESPADLIAQGLLGKDGKLRGVCDTFEYFLGSLYENVYGEKAVSTQSGYSLNSSVSVNVMLHGQTRLHVPEEGIDALIDIEPDPATAEINSDIFEVRRVSRRERVKKTLSRWISRISKEPPTQTKVAPAESPQSAGPREEISIEFVLPSPDEAARDEIKIYKDGETVTLKGDEAAAYWRDVEEKAMTSVKEDELLQESKAVNNRFKRMLLGYLGENLDSKYEDMDNIILGKVAPLLEERRVSGAGWETMPLHLQLYRLARGYFELNGPDHARGERFSVDPGAISGAKETLEQYKEGGQLTPSYDPRFLDVMGQLVDMYSRIAEYGPVRIHY